MKKKNNKAADAIATWFGCGLSPVAPGTVGALAALGIGIVLAEVAHWRPVSFLWLTVAASLPAIWAADVSARASGKKDPGRIVVDEVLGLWLTLAGATAWNWKSFLGAFVLFRLFDIWKPGPVRSFEKLSGGLGIVADDLAAGALGALVLFGAGCFNLY